MKSIKVGETCDNSLGKTRKVDEIRQWISYLGHDAIVCFMGDIWTCAAYLTAFDHWAETEVAE